MSTTTEATPPPPDVARPSGSGAGGAGGVGVPGVPATAGVQAGTAGQARGAGQVRAAGQAGSTGSIGQAAQVIQPRQPEQYAVGGAPVATPPATPPAVPIATAARTAPIATYDPYLRGTDETVLLDLRELRAQQAADAARAGSGPAGPAPGPGAELEAYQGSHRREAMLYAHGGTAIPLERVREVCHDLRQPVAAILMLASAAEMRPDVPERVRDVLQEIMTQTEDISATVRQFLDDAKQGVDGLGDPVPCNVAGLAAESVERWRATFSGRISLAAEPDPLHVTVDPVLFKRALGNVLSNGTRAAGGTGHVQVTVRRFQTGQGERAVIEVDDSGPGFGNIPAGHGLGLAVVRRTVEAAGGSVEVATGPLGGALIRLVLPVTPIRPLSAGDEPARTVHGEVSLSALAEELAAGGLRRAVIDFDEFDGFDGFDDLDEFDDFDEDDEFDDPAGVTGGHAFATRISAVPEATAIGRAPEQTAISGSSAYAALSGAGSAPRLASGPELTPAGAGGAAEPQASEVFGAPEPSGAFDAFRAPSRGHSQEQPEIGYATPLWARQTASEPEAASQTAEALAAPAQALEAALSRSGVTIPAGAVPAGRDSAAERASAAAVPAEGADRADRGGRARAEAAAPAERAVPVGTGTARAEAADPAADAADAADAAEPGAPEPVRITATGQDDTALATIQLPPPPSLPSRAGLTNPPRVPASALRPVAAVQLSLLPGGAF